MGLWVDGGTSTGSADAGRLGCDVFEGTLEVCNSVAEAGRALGPGAVLGRRGLEDGAACEDMEERELGRRGSV